MVNKPSTGGAVIVLVVIILFILLLTSDINFKDIKVEEHNDENVTGSKTLHKLNPDPTSCNQCISNCQWTTLNSEENCRQDCKTEQYC